jgi:predicted secreted protein
MLGPEQVDLLTNIVWWTALVEVVLFFVRATDADENPAR